LVTGASSGIGAALARQLAHEGARLILCGRDPERLQAIAEQVRGRAPEVDPQRLELGDEASVRRVAARAQATFGGVDALVHCAGVFTRSLLADTPMVELDEQWRVNVRGPYLLTQLLLPGLVARRGQIVFMSSTTGKIARAGVSAYAASKFALRGIADALREEMAPLGVRVASIFPGRTATPMQELVCRLEGKPYHPEKLMQPEDVAAMTVATLKLPRTAEVTELDVRQCLS
jgi:NAD(P)-dependent dehydrogenase (short-subunit alcohol dehydrogenase family)